MVKPLSPFTPEGSGRSAVVEKLNMPPCKPRHVKGPIKVKLEVDPASEAPTGRIAEVKSSVPHAQTLLHQLVQLTSTLQPQLARVLQADDPTQSSRRSP